MSHETYILHWGHLKHAEWWYTQPWHWGPADECRYIELGT